MKVGAEIENGRFRIEPEDFSTAIEGDTAYVTMKYAPSVQFECRMVDGIWLFHTGPGD